MKQLKFALGMMLWTSILSSDAQAQDPGDDDPVQWIIDHGFSSIHFMQRCVSVGQDGSVIETAPLPVGGGRKLICHTYRQVGRDVTEVQADSGEVYCVRGALSRTRLAGDDRLRLRLVNNGMYGPAWLEATADTPITISMVSAFGGGQAWPLWLSSDYTTQQVVPDPGDGRSCRQVFGL